MFVEEERDSERSKHCGYQGLSCSILSRFLPSFSYSLFHHAITPSAHTLLIRHPSHAATKSARKEREERNYTRKREERFYQKEKRRPYLESINRMLHEPLWTRHDYSYICLSVCLCLLMSLDELYSPPEHRVSARWTCAGRAAKCLSKVEICTDLHVCPLKQFVLFWAINIYYTFALL